MECQRIGCRNAYDIAAMKTTKFLHLREFDELASTSAATVRPLENVRMRNSGKLSYVNFIN